MVSPEHRGPCEHSLPVREEGFSNRPRCRENPGLLRPAASLRPPDPAAGGMLARGRNCLERPMHFGMGDCLTTARVLALSISQLALVSADAGIR